MEKEEQTEKVLKEFLSKSEDDLYYVCIKDPTLVEEEFRDYVKAAWEEVKNRIQQADKELSRLQGKIELMRKLEDAGLSGSQLKFKDAGFRRSHQEFQEALRIPKPLGPIIRKLLAWMNIILGSLAAVLPVLEPVKEFKEALEQSLV